MGHKIEVCSGQESSSFLREKVWSHTTAETEPNTGPQTSVGTKEGIYLSPGANGC